MIRQGDAVVYKWKGVYKVEKVGTLDFTFADRKKQYYTLQSVVNEKDRAYVPIDDEKNIRKPIEQKAIFELIDRMDDIEILWVQNEKLREREYKDCISGHLPESWIRVLKTLYERTVRRGSITSMDKRYQQLLEHALYSEFSYVLGIPESKVGDFIYEHRKRTESRN
ncbi:MAG: CarD-like/TRCF domain protein [Ruminococcus sp.]|nr:CarD-like/TRCF domain protein [Ruminococcus sp.]